MAFEVGRRALIVEKEASEVRWVHAKAITKVKHMRSALKKANNGITLEKAQIVNAQATVNKVVEEERMVIEEIKYGTFEEITWLQNDLYTDREKINFLAYLVSQERSVVAKLTRELDTSKEALQNVKEKTI